MSGVILLAACGGSGSDASSSTGDSTSVGSSVVGAPALASLQIVDVVAPEGASEAEPGALLLGGEATVELTFEAMTEVAAVEGSLLFQDAGGANNRIITISESVTGLAGDGSFIIREPIDLDLVGPVRLRARGTFGGVDAEFDVTIEAEVLDYEPPPPAPAPDPLDELVLVDDDGVTLFFGTALEVFIPHDDLLEVAGRGYDPDVSYDLPSGGQLSVSLHRLISRTPEELLDQGPRATIDGETLVRDEAVFILGVDGWVVASQHSASRVATVQWFAFFDEIYLWVLLTTDETQVSADSERVREVIDTMIVR